MSELILKEQWDTYSNGNNSSDKLKALILIHDDLGGRRVRIREWHCILATCSILWDLWKLTLWVLGHCEFHSLAKDERAGYRISLDLKLMESLNAAIED